jgi:UDPglucose 6-dehydrogenase
LKIGIIGLGKVGRTIYKSLSLFHENIKGFDIDPNVSRNTFLDVLDTDIVFFALPTPLGDNKRLNCSLISNYLKAFEEKQYKGLIIIKSTLSLGFLKNIEGKCLRVVYSPEFLHEKTSIQDFINPKFIITSGSKEDCLWLKKVFYWIPPEKFYRTDDRTVELIKLTMNAFAATKISFVNEIERICSIHGADVTAVMKFLRMDGRCANEYSYPLKGPFKGRCLPKDLQELMNTTKDTYLLEAVHKVNERRKKYV